MDRWVDKVAVVTGASSGIGAKTVISLIEAGITVVGLARRVEKIEDLRSKLNKNSIHKLYAMKCDVSNEEEVISTFATIENSVGLIHILISNAAVFLDKFKLVGKENGDELRETVNTNILGSTYCIREAFQSMHRNHIAGQIIIINSIVGHNIPFMQTGSLNMYAPSKHALVAIVEVLRQEFQGYDSKVKITDISPGGVDTGMVPVELKNLLKYKMLDPEDISQAILYVLSTPPHVQIHELIIKPVGEIF